MSGVNDSLVIYSNQVSVSESESNPDVYICKFVLSDFGVNGNDVALNRDTITEWMDTIKNQPVVGKIKARRGKRNEYDFTDHAMRLVESTDEDGNVIEEVEFDTDAFGTFTDVSIEEIDGVEYLVATAQIWKRFKKACEVIISRIKRGTLHTSWEVKKTEIVQKFIKGRVIEIINYGRFFGHALLGECVEPAYSSSKLVSIAQKENKSDYELATAIAEDILFSNINKSTEQEEGNLSISVNEPKVQDTENENASEAGKEVEGVVTARLETTAESTAKVAGASEEKGEVVSTEGAVANSSAEQIEMSALTENDLRAKIWKACQVKLEGCCWIAFHFPVDKLDSRCIKVNACLLI